MVSRAGLLEAGAVIFREGEKFEAPYIVTSGCMAITELLADGRERIVAFRVPGEVIGLESCDRRTHRYGAQALCQTSLCRMRWPSSATAVRSPALLRALLSQATRSPPGVIPWPGLTAIERVRAFAEDFRARTDQPMPMTRAQIGSYLGMAEETVVRAFKALDERASA